MAIQYSTDEGLRELALFAGAGGGILGGHLLGWRTVCAVERDAYAAQVLAQRQTDGILRPFPIWSDVTTFDGKPWRGRVDVVSGGFPCQDISTAGKGAGITGERSGLWSHMARIIREIQPRYAFIENSPMLVNRGLDTVLCALAEMGFDAEWGIIGADDLGALHRRERIWIVASDPKRVPKREESRMRSIGRMGGSSNPWRGTEIGKISSPAFEEWLMDWPVQWTELTVYEMDKFQQWQQQHGGFLADETN